MKIGKTGEKVAFDSRFMPRHSCVNGSPVACRDSINLLCISVRVLLSVMACYELFFIAF